VRLSAWRITQRDFAASVFTGEGARLYGGRWNSPGVAIVYTAESRALAALEILVHLESPQLLESYLLFEVTFDESLVQELDRRNLPADWRRSPAPASTRAIGDIWAASADSPILLVPSTLISGEANFLLNPTHPNFAELEISAPEPFTFDPRLVGK
jgi:RES domain-containing protein